MSCGGSICGGSSSSTPTYDYNAAAQAQSGVNRDTAIAQASLNMINQNTPYGNLTYSQTNPNYSQASDLPTYEQTITLPDQLQNALTSTYNVTEGLTTGAEQLADSAISNLTTPFSPTCGC